MDARGLPACLLGETASGVANATNQFLALDRGRTYISVVQDISVEVLLGMSALRMCKGIITARYSRVRGP